MHKIVMLRVEAPDKAGTGQPCNGCGVCCVSEPCPVGVLFTGRTRGACRALDFSDERGRYLCGLVSDPASRLPRVLRWSAPWISRLARRFIAAGRGCDSDVEASPAREAVSGTR